MPKICSKKWKYFEDIRAVWIEKDSDYMGQNIQE